MEISFERARVQRSVGKVMMKAICEHPDLRTLRRFCYAPFGFTAVNADRWMEKLSRKRSPPHVEGSRDGDC